MSDNDDAKIYCGVKKLPKGHKLGNSTECVKKGRIGLYGLNKVDSVTVENAHKIKQSTIKATNRLNKLNALISKHKKNALEAKTQYQTYTRVGNKKKAEEAKNKYKDNLTKHNDYVKEHRKINNQLAPVPEIAKAVDRRITTKHKPEPLPKKLPKVAKKAKNVKKMKGGCESCNTPVIDIAGASLAIPEVTKSVANVSASSGSASMMNLPLYELKRIEKELRRK